MVNGINDTPSGMVSKTNEFSIPKTQKELDQIADMYRSMGFSIFNDSKNFLCGNRTIFTDFNDCKGCGCEKCNGGTKAKGYGIRGQNITKKL